MKNWCEELDGGIFVFMLKPPLETPKRCNAQTVGGNAAVALVLLFTDAFSICRVRLGGNPSQIFGVHK